MPTVDPHAADPTKVTASLAREARSLLRRADKLASAVRAADDPTTTRLDAEARRAIEQSGPPEKAMPATRARAGAAHIPDETFRIESQILAEGIRAVSRPSCQVAITPACGSSRQQW